MVNKYKVLAFLLAAGVMNAGMASTIDFSNISAISSNVSQSQCEQLFARVVNYHHSKSNPVKTIKVTDYNTMKFDTREKVVRDGVWTNSGTANISLDKGKTFQIVKFAVTGIQGQGSRNFNVVDIGGLCLANVKSMPRSSS